MYRIPRILQSTELKKISKMRGSSEILNHTWKRDESNHGEGETWETSRRERIQGGKREHD